MGEVPLSLHVDARLKEKLEAEARLQEVSESEIAERAIRAFLDRQAYKRDVVETATDEADHGEFISSEAVLEWIGRLEEDKDAPAPRSDAGLPQHR